MKSLLIGLILFVSSIVSNANILIGNTFIMNYDHQETLFGNPIIVQDTILFFPTTFKAISVGSPSIVSSTFTFNITPKPGYSLSNLNLFESGDYTATGIAASSGQLKIKSLDPLTPTINQILISSPTPSQVNFSLAEWNINNNINLNNSYSTQITLENVLFATSTGPGTFSFIEKKEVDFSISTILSPVPENSSLIFLSVGLVGLFLRHKKS